MTRLGLRAGLLSIAVACAGCAPSDSRVRLLRSPLPRFGRCEVQLYPTPVPPPGAVVIATIEAVCPAVARGRCISRVRSDACDAGGNIVFDVRERTWWGRRFGLEGRFLTVVATAGFLQGAPPPAPPPPAVPSAPSAPCVPECRQGFDCIGSQCVPACNPPCPGDQRCMGHGALATCEPLPIPASPAPPGAPPAPAKQR
jgi:hypothetical protein